MADGNVVLPTAWKFAGPDSANVAFQKVTGLGIHQCSRFRIRFCDLGEGSLPLLLIHGIGSSLDVWAAMLPFLASRERVIAIDLPGFGASSMPNGSRLNMRVTVEAICTLMDKLGVERCAVAGHSMGALVALAVAAQRPLNIDRLFILSGALHSILDLHRPRALVKRGELTAGIRRARVYATQLLGAGIPMPRLASKAIARSERLRRLVLSPYVSDTNALPDDVLLSVLESTGRRGVLYAALAAFSFRYEPLMQTIRENQIRAILMNGEHDKISPTCDLERALAGLRMHERRCNSKRRGALATSRTTKHMRGDID